MPKFVPVWFESLGSKASVVYVETKDVKIIIDPGLSALQPSFPISEAQKIRYNLMGYRAIQEFASKADIVVITHYHYDHFEDPYSTRIDANIVYRDKFILVKDPNIFINQSQYERARIFLGHMVEYFLGRSLEEFLVAPQKVDFGDPLEQIPIARQKDFGDYNRRRKELLEIGEKRFLKLVDMWTENSWIREIKENNLHIEFADGKEFVFGSTRIRFTKPMFHGVEFDRLGWVIGAVIETKDWKLLYTSDVQGPIIEDYAEWIIKENPTVAIIDGPPTYQLGYLMTRTTLKRAIDNMISILKETTTRTIIWDHHLLRDPLWRNRVKMVLDKAKELNKRLITAAEFHGKKPIADKVRVRKTQRNQKT